MEAHFNVFIFEIKLKKISLLQQKIYHIPIYPSIVKRVPSPFTLVRNVLVVAIQKYYNQVDWVVIPKNTTKGQYLKIQQDNFLSLSVFDRS